MRKAWLEELDEEECLAMLEEHVVGRIAFVAEGMPVILPVNYRLLETSSGPVLILRTRPGNVIDRAPEPVAFELDGVDQVRAEGWSVLVRGSLRRPSASTPELALLSHLIPWIETDRDSWLVIDPVEITGRRLVAASVEWAFSASAYL